ncbi:hypothetical protein [Peribacillus asahii]|nr:hypothetical protein [Peribacillus asahii]
MNKYPYFKQKISFLLVIQKKKWFNDWGKDEAMTVQLKMKD